MEKVEFAVTKEPKTGLPRRIAITGITGNIHYGINLLDKDGGVVSEGKEVNFSLHDGPGMDRPVKPGMEGEPAEALPEEVQKETAARETLKQKIGSAFAEYYKAVLA